MPQPPVKAASSTQRFLIRTCIGWNQEAMNGRKHSNRSDPRRSVMCLCPRRAPIARFFRRFFLISSKFHIFGMGGPQPNGAYKCEGINQPLCQTLFKSSNRSPRRHQALETDGSARHFVRRAQLAIARRKVSLFFPPHAVLVSILLLVPTLQWWAYTLAAASAHFLATQRAQWPPLYALHCEAFDVVQNVATAAARGSRHFAASLVFDNSSAHLGGAPLWPSNCVLHYDGTTGAFLGVFASGGELNVPYGYRSTQPANGRRGARGCPSEC